MKMKFNLLPLLMVPVIALFSFTINFAGGIKGVIDPAANAGDVWAIMGNDSTKVTSLQGVFQISDLKADTYKIVVEGKAPYKNYEKEGVVVKDGETLDLGKITLNQ
ncbi:MULTISPECIES: carboxypeptidase-like regulatory domain-containing protein [Niastella]|uniref:Carboxypeptidase regulatory-like domain-containing protein n=1 Tax=Niastella soli TaxID=2821487 RepID=A0ABS3YRN0_9BACT|nr:carboxypeptidase-like regulatory domain-containing protein [Niastella soli]MBO9200499.1 carboxypeptidase regulatory-like domain-containing protein [Niastella soli]